MAQHCITICKLPFFYPSAPENNQLLSCELQNPTRLSHYLCQPMKGSHLYVNIYQGFNDNEMYYS